MPDGEQDSVVPSGGTGGQGSSTRSNELLSAMDDKLQFLVDALRAEVEESKGREARLLSRISDLTDSICHLKDELLGVRKLAQITQDARHPIGINKAKENSKKSKKIKKHEKNQNDHMHSATSADAEQVVDMEPDTPNPPADAETFSNLSTPECDSDGFREVVSKRVLRRRTTPRNHSDAWKLVAAEPPQTKRAVVYIGNLSTSCTESSLKEYIQVTAAALPEPQSISVLTCSMYTSPHGRVSARVAVDASLVNLLTDPEFWPRPLYCRPWKFDAGRKHSSAHNAVGPSVSESSTQSAGQDADNAERTMSVLQAATQSAGQDAANGVRHQPPPLTPAVGKSRSYERSSPPALPDSKRPDGAESETTSGDGMSNTEDQETTQCAAQEST